MSQGDVKVSQTGDVKVSQGDVKMSQGDVKMSQKEQNIDCWMVTVIGATAAGDSFIGLAQTREIARELAMEHFAALGIPVDKIKHLPWDLSDTFEARYQLFPEDKTDTYEVVVAKRVKMWGNKESPDDSMFRALEEIEGKIHESRALVQKIREELGL